MADLTTGGKRRWCRKQVRDFIPELWSLSSLLVIPQHSQWPLHLEVSEPELQPTPQRQMLSWGRWKRRRMFFTSRAMELSLPSAWECSATRGEEQKMVNEPRSYLVTNNHQKLCSVNTWLHKNEPWRQIWVIFSLRYLLVPSPPLLCTLFEVNLVLFVPHAACSCCWLFYKSIGRLTSLVFEQFLCHMSLCRVPGFKGKLDTVFMV